VNLGAASFPAGTGGATAQDHTAVATKGPAMSDPSAQYAPPRSSAAGGRPYVIAGFVCALIAVGFLPIVLGPAAIVLGFLAHRKRDPLGRWVMIAGAIGMILGFVVGALVFAESQESAAPTLAAALGQSR
jgi:hypothetical protein